MAAVRNVATGNLVTKNERNSDKPLSKEKAVQDADRRNERAKELGIEARYEATDK